MDYGLIRREGKYPEYSQASLVWYSAVPGEVRAPVASQLREAGRYTTGDIISQRWALQARACGDGVRVRLAPGFHYPTSGRKCHCVVDMPTVSSVVEVP
jgi:hypothetical protein